MHKNGSIGRIALISIAASAILLQGCLAAAIPLMIGAQAFNAYKTIQMSTGEGQVQIGFDKETFTAAEKASLAQIRSLAIMPLAATDTTLEVAMAETISASGALQVFTPAAVLRAQPDGNDAVNFNVLTRMEKMDVIRALCKELGAEGLVYANLVGSQTSANIWSFSRANQVYQIEMTIYSSHEDRFVVIDGIKAQITMGGNSNMTDMNEISRIIGATMGERILSALQ